MLGAGGCWADIKVEDVGVVGRIISHVHGHQGPRLRDIFLFHIPGLKLVSNSIYNLGMRAQCPKTLVAPWSVIRAWTKSVPTRVRMLVDAFVFGVKKRIRSRNGYETCRMALRALVSSRS